MSFRGIPGVSDALMAVLRGLRDDIDRLANGGAIKGQVSFDPVIRIGDVIVTAGDGTLTFTDALTGAVIDPYPPAPAGATYLTGQIDSAGGVTAGTGFTVNHTGTGVYAVTFDTAFAAAPTVVATLGATVAGRVVRVAATSVTGCTIEVVSAASVGVADDQPFNFAAFVTV